MPFQCWCSAGHCNSSFGFVQCLPTQIPTEVGPVCRACDDYLDCSADLSPFRRALVAPGFALGPTATRTHIGIKRGRLHLNKVLHPCSPGMCAGEATMQTRDSITLEPTANRACKSKAPPERNSKSSWLLDWHCFCLSPRMTLLSPVSR